jgi:hypothetical protein
VNYESARILNDAVEAYFMLLKETVNKNRKKNLAGL